jgi:hypothetical protein
VDVAIKIPLLDLETALAKKLKGAKILRLELDQGRGRLHVAAPLVGEVHLLADYASSPGQLVFSRFSLDGGGFAQGLVLSKLRSAISELDTYWDPFRIYGESDGERLHIAWDTD